MEYFANLQLIFFNVNVMDKILNCPVTCSAKENVKTLKIIYFLKVEESSEKGFCAV